MIVGRPSTVAFLDLLKRNVIANCPVTPADVEAAEHIFGPDIGSLKGKTKRRNPPIVESPVTPVPTNILKRYQKVTLCVDIMYVNRVVMVVSISRNIKFRTIKAIPNNKSGVILKSMQAIIQIYRRNGFAVELALMDGEFVHLRGELASMGVTLNDTSCDEHVGDVERFIRTIKERMRAIYNTLPFQKVPARLIVEMGKASVFLLNSVPQKNGLASKLSPRTIVTGQKLDFKRHCRFQFGQYVQTHEEHNNSMSPRTVGALALRPTGNAQGSFYFMSLSTGRVLNRLRGTALPMPDDVIDRVHRMARQQKADPGLLFGDRNMNPIYDEMSNDEEDEDYLPDSRTDEESRIDDDEDGSNGDNLDDEGPTEGDGDELLNDDNGPWEYDAAPELVNTEGLGVGRYENSGVGGTESIGVDQAEDEMIHQDGESDDDPEVYKDSKTSVEDDEKENATIGETEVEPSGESRYNLREKRTRSYNHLYDPEMFRTEDSQNNKQEEVVLVTDGDAPKDTPQMSMKRGLRMFGEEGYTAVRKEMQQLHDRKVMQPVKRKDLTPVQKREALGYLMFLKKKRNGTVKGRGCADKRKQRAYITKEDSTSPTISTEAVFLTAVVDAWEGRKVAVLDVPGAFMQVDMDETVHVRFDGETVDKLLEIDEHLYASYVTEEKGKKAMYVELLKALYGTLRAAQLFWEKLQAKLVNDWGFTPNRYDSCVVNKKVNGKQLTVAWHMDDLKVSHQDETALDEFIAMMEEEFGKETPLTIARGPIQEYLRMTLDFTEKGKVVVKMSAYIKNMLKDAPASMDGHAITPAATHLFKVNTDNPKLMCKEKKELFVHLVMQGLYLSQRGRPDIRTAISFLCSRLNCPDKDDFKKLTRMIWYLRHTLYMCLVLGKDDSDSVRWWIDASYAVHPNMRGHTGATMSMGNGSIYSGSWKQKMVTQSSTESEVVGVHDVLPQILWTKKFLEDQGMSIKETVLYQDNMSSMLLERNGQQSSTKRTKHMDIWYFYVSDHVQNKTLSLKHCPTEEMLADYFTKPLQGALFNRLRNHIMGVEFANGDPQTHRSVLDDDDDETQKGASDQDQKASEQNETASDQDQNGASEQNEIALDEDQNHEKVCKNIAPAREQNSENMCEMSAPAREQNNANMGRMSETQDYNNKNVAETNPRLGGKNTKQMTYREALVGVDNSDPSSDFKIYLVCEGHRKRIRSV